MTRDPRYPFALDLGTEIGGYHIDQVLGAGGFGITYRGYNDITHKQVAIKEFYVREISSREGATVIVDEDVERATYEYALKKFQDEAQSVVTRFKHPYIIRGENFLRAHNTCYLIMEYVEGSNLDDWLRGRAEPPAEAEIRPMFEKLFEAVDYVHHRNMMHRDLTPRNIMVRPNGDPVLIDFGAAGLGIDLGRSSKIVAQLRYAPPEQSDETASGIHGRYTDIFSLAGVLFRIVTGKTPMAPTVRLTRLSQQRDVATPIDPQGPVATQVADPTRYSTQFLAGIDRGLLLDERRRPQSIAEFRVALGWADASILRAEAHADAATEILSPPPRIPVAAPATIIEAETRIAPLHITTSAPRAAAVELDPTVALNTRPTPRPPSGPTVSTAPAAAAASPKRRRGNVVLVGVGLVALLAGAGALFQSDIRRFLAERGTIPAQQTSAQQAPARQAEPGAPAAHAPQVVGSTPPPQETGQAIARLPAANVPVAPAAAAPAKAAAPAEDPAALYNEAQQTERGEAGRVRSLSEAVRLYGRAAAAGSIDAELRLGLIAEAGTLTGTQDLPAARAHFKKAAEAGNPVAMERLALSLLKANDGKPSAADGVTARNWLIKAADAGRIGEATTLASLLLDDNVGPTDAAKAHQVLALAAGKGNAAAMVDLARLDFLGLGVLRDLTAAGDWTERAVSAGRPDAYARLAALYRTDTADGRRPDFAAAFLWAQKGTARSEPMAYFELGLLYEGGLGRPIDFAKAEENFGRAADLGFARATYELGLLSEAGHGRSTDLIRAAGYFKRAADQGYVPAMIRYGQLAAAGRGTSRDDAAALVAFTKALQLGDADGYWQAALLTDAGRGGPRNPQRAADYILEAVQRGSAAAIGALEGNLSEVSEDARRALKTLLLARGLVPVPSSGDSFGISEREALLASARSVR